MFENDGIIPAYRDQYLLAPIQLTLYATQYTNKQAMQRRANGENPVGNIVITGELPDILLNVQKGQYDKC